VSPSLSQKYDETIIAYSVGFSTLLDALSLTQKFPGLFLVVIPSAILAIFVISPSGALLRHDTRTK
jgi:hypothetical protein